MVHPPILRLCLALILSLSGSQAAVIAHYSFTEGSLSNTASPIHGLSVSPVDTNSSFNSFISTSGWDSAAQISGANSFFSGATTHTMAGNAIYFTVTAGEGYRFHIESFGFRARSTPSAPTDIGFTIGDFRYDFSESYTNDSTITQLFKGSLGLNDLESVTISIQGWNSPGASALQLDDLILSGTFVPEVSTSALFMIGMLILLRRKR